MWRHHFRCIWLIKKINSLSNNENNWRYWRLQAYFYFSKIHLLTPTYFEHEYTQQTNNVKRWSTNLCILQNLGLGIEPQYIFSTDRNGSLAQTHRSKTVKYWMHSMSGKYLVDLFFDQTVQSRRCQFKIRFYQEKVLRASFGIFSPFCL